MEFESFAVRYDDGEYQVAISVRENSSRFTEFEGAGSTISEALYDLAEQLEIVDV